MTELCHVSAWLGVAAGAYALRLGYHDEAGVWRTRAIENRVGDDAKGAAEAGPRTALEVMAEPSALSVLVADLDVAEYLRVLVYRAAVRGEHRVSVTWRSETGPATDEVRACDARARELADELR